jgi:tRNA-splicing ligase RtcB
MAQNHITGKDLIKLGFPEGKIIALAMGIINGHTFKKKSAAVKLEILAKVLANPQAFEKDLDLQKIARALQPTATESKNAFLMDQYVPYTIFGAEQIEEQAIRQIELASRLPIAVAAALMPDAHYGYGLPIGGVLATNQAVIPYGVGVDIGCRMCLSVFDMPENYLERHRENLKKLLLDHTAFGSGNSMKKPMDDKVLCRPEFKEIKVVKNLYDKACQQIGSSGSGNHFVEFGTLQVAQHDPVLNLAPGTYLALLSHSGSRALGANVAEYYTRVARELCRLPKEANHLAWLTLSSQEGQEYWRAMKLAGDYASACHHHIHQRIAKALGERPLARVENHHNFAWKEQLPDGTEVIVHRKGATPAGAGVLGIIPGSMASPGFVVKGKGLPGSLNSASHGAGRCLSRSQAKQQINRKMLNDALQKQGVTLLGGDLDEAPMAYKDIRTVMAAQQNLVDILGTFHPAIVRMDGAVTT